MTFLRGSAVALALLLCVPPIHAQSNVKTINVTFTTIDVPGAGVTGVYGINSAGDMVGYYGASSNDLNKHGFLLSGGTFTYLDYPGADATFAYAINDAGLIIGSAEFNGGLQIEGFSYDGSTFTPIRDGRLSTTITYAISSIGDIVGGAGGPYTTKGIELHSGKFKTLNVPGTYSYVFASGINKRGTIVGWADQDGFVCRGGTCQILDYPGANQTANRGVNDQGIVVGWYFLSGIGYAFALRNGKYLSFAYPGAAATAATAINSFGQVVGQYTFDYQTFHGFLTSPITGADFE